MAGEIIQGGDVAPGQGSADGTNEDQASADARVLETDHDYLLASFINTVEEQERVALAAGDEAPFTPVTLTVNGLVVSGKLVGHKTWTRSFLSDDEDSEDGPEQNETIEWWQRRHIHLIDAQILSGAQFVPSTGGVAWRGRLSHVSGWFFGTIGHGDS